MSTWRDYRGIIVWHRITIQWISYRQRLDRWTIHLLPQISIAHNDTSELAIGFEWFSGCVNFAYATKEFAEGEKNRRKRNKEYADKLGVPLTVYEAGL